MNPDSRLLLFARTSLVLLACGTIVFGSQNSHAQSSRTWTDKTGKFSVDAILLKSSTDSVVLKRSDGKEITVPKNRLSKSDLDFLAELDNPAEREPRTTGELLEKIKVAAKAVWAKDKFGGPSNLEVQITASGTPAKNATHIGMFDLRKLTDQEGGDIKQKKPRFQLSDIAKEFEKVERPENEMFEKHPKNGVQVKCVIETEEVVPTQISELVGSFKIQTGGKKTEIKIANISSFVGKPVVNEQASKFGFELSVELEDDKNSAGGKYLTVRVDGKVDDLMDVKVVNAKGKKPENQTGWSHSGSIHGFFFDGAITPDVALVLVAVTDRTEVEIPFEFKSLRIPKKK